jgi:predicted dehydrogenase
MEMTRVGIVGCGLIGNKRARSLENAQVVAVSDVDLARTAKLASALAGCEAMPEWRALVVREDVDVVIVATTNDALATVTQAAIERGKHVLVEKPAARNAAELRPLVALARQHGRVVKVGFNHRFHPSFLKMRELVDGGAIGPLMYLRARYGHGGRLGYEREWRADPERAGGGELLDQGVHLIDLARWFLGDFTEVQGHVGTFFWDMPVEDNGFLLLRDAGERVALLHASCSEWKNMFSFELYGRTGKLQVDGLGGSYGLEKLTFHHMLPQLGPPETAVWEYPGEDGSWRAEWRHFQECLAGRVQPLGGLEDALAALDVVAKAYALPGRRLRPVAQ